MLESMGKSKRRSGARVKHVQSQRSQQGPATPAGSAHQVTRSPAAQLLERIEHARHIRDEAEADLAVLIDQAVDLGIGWPQIAAELGVTRQAARQHYQRRHYGTSRQDHMR